MATPRGIQDDGLIPASELDVKTPQSIQGDGLIPASELDRKTPPKRKKWLIIGIISLLSLLVVALGAALGVKLQRSKTKENSDGAVKTTGSTTTAQSSGSVDTRGARADSGLSVTGWRSGLDFSIRLYYQDASGPLKMGKYDSNASAWRGPESLVNHAKAGTSIGVSAFSQFALWGTRGPELYQNEIFYLDGSSQLREWNVIDTKPQNNGSLSQQTYITRNDSPIATYWPSIFFQREDAMIEEVRYESLAWSSIKLDAKGASKSSLVALPLRSDFLNSGIRLLYQRDDQKLIDFVRNDTDAWTTGSLSTTIPSGAKFGAFAVAKPDNSSKAMSTYVLWQDDSGAVQMTWQDDGSGWKGPKVCKVFTGIDKGSAISCLTPTAWPTSTLQAKWDMTRCYFQARGVLQEALFDGSHWSLLKDPLS